MASSSGRARGLLAASLSIRASNTGAVVRPNPRTPTRPLISPPTTAHPDTFAAFFDVASSEGFINDESDQSKSRSLFDDHQNDGIDSRLDCPIRAGPYGRQRCGWKPTDGTCGFPSLPRVKEHVGSHGLECTICRQVFIRHSHYVEHLNHKDDNESCRPSRHAKQRPRRYRIAYPPEVIEAFFRRVSKDERRSVHDAWLDGYKIFHENWQNHVLPSPSFQQNIARENETLSQIRSPGASATDVIRSPASPASPPSGITEELSYSPTSPRPFFIAGSPRNPINLSHLSSSPYVDLIASNDGEYVRAPRELPTFDQVDGNYIDTPDTNESGDLQLGDCSTMHQLFGHHTVSDQMNLDAQYISPEFAENRNPYSFSGAEAIHTVDPTALQNAPTTSTVSSYEQNLSRSTTHRPLLSLQSTAASSAASDFAQHVPMGDFKNLHVEVNQLKWKLQKTTRSSRTIKNQLDDLEQQNERLSTILNQIDQELFTLEVGSGSLLNADGRFSVIRQTILNIRQLLDQRHGQDVDVEMLGDERTPTPFGQPP